jgi:hypothetical protein
MSKARSHDKPAARTAGLLALWLGCCLSGAALADTAGWDSGTVDDDNIAVKYRVSERINENGAEVPLIEYVASTTAKISLQRWTALLSDVARHKDFMGDKLSKKVAALSDTESVVYSFYDAPWPFPDNDRVTRMKRTEDGAARTTVFTFAAAPALVQPSQVKRVTHYRAVYTFKDLGDGTAQLTIAMTMSPPNGAPLWMIRAAFPGVGADILRKILKLAGSAA